MMREATEGRSGVFRSEPDEEIGNCREVTVLIDFHIYFSLFQPIIQQLVLRRVRVYIVCSDDIRENIAHSLPQDERLTYVSLDAIRAKHRTRFKVHRISSLLLTSRNFSHQYSKKHKQVNISSDRTQRTLLSASRYLPSVPNKQINKALNWIGGFRLRNPFPTERVLVGSLNSCAELLCGSHLKAYTVMESWDHSVKIPNGYSSEKVFVWNRELGKDWENCQSESQWEEFYPLKLWAAIDYGSRHMSRVREDCNSRKMVYAVASTDRYSGSLTLSIEQRIIRALCVATESAGWTFFIKPRPNGRPGEFDKYIHEFPHVSVGCLSDQNGSVAANYCLTSEYNQRRFSEVIDAQLVVNAFTTFGLDAAMLGLPVLQLDLRSCPGYEDSVQVYDNHHIKKYLVSRVSSMTVDSMDLGSAIAAYLEDPTGLAPAFTADLRDWLLPSISRGEAIERLIDTVLRID